MSELALLAQRQLNAWRHYALRWGIRTELKVTAYGHLLGPGISQWHFVCAGLHDGAPEWDGCGQTVIVLHDGANGYTLTEQEIRDALVDHLRRSHQKIEPVVYEGVDFIG